MNNITATEDRKPAPTIDEMIESLQAIRDHLEAENVRASINDLTALDSRINEYETFIRTYDAEQ